VRKAAFASSAHVELPVTGVPDVARVALFVWPEPLGKTRRLAVDVVRLDDTVLKTPVQFTFELRPAERPTVADELPAVVVGVETPSTPASAWCERPRLLRLKGPEGPVTWQLVEAPGTEREVRRLERDGTPVFGTVDTATYCYRLTCPRCGRVRYSKANSVHQIHLCWVCTRSERLRHRALRQYQSRRGRKR
jgi:hypothetical protein